MLLGHFSTINILTALLLWIIQHFFWIHLDPRFVIFQFRSTDERDKSMHDQYEQLSAIWFVRLKALYRNSLIYNNNDNLYHLILRTKLDHFVTVVKNELNSFLNILWRMAFVLKLYNVPFLYLSIVRVIMKAKLIKDIYVLLIALSYCKFWIYWVGVNTKFTIWQLVVIL